MRSINTCTDVATGVLDRDAWLEYHQDLWKKQELRIKSARQIVLDENNFIIITHVTKENKS